MVKKNRIGEIATIVALGSLIILGLSSLVSSVFLKNKQTTKTKAEEKCVYKDYDECRAFGCSDSECVRCDDYTYKCIGTSSTAGSCQCLSGKATGPCGDVNPCGSEMGGCSEYGAWKTDCTGSNQNCPADAGVAYTSWCDGKNWRFQYPNCVTWCKVEYLNNPPPASQKDPLCQDKSPGDFITDSFNGTLPTGVEKGADKSLPSYKYVSCDGNVGVWVEVQPFCDQFGKIQWSPGRKSDVSCIPPNINISKTPVGSFWLTAKVEAKKDDKKIKFDTTVIFNSTDCDGDITLYRNGGLVAHNRWNSGGKQSFTFEYYPEWTGSISLGPGKKETVVYQGRIDNCPRSKVPLQDTVSCEFGVSPYGEPWVRGQGCNLVNFDEVVKITPLLTPVTQPRVTWANPPPITPKITPFIFKTSTNSSGSPGTCIHKKCSDDSGSADYWTDYKTNKNFKNPDCTEEITKDIRVYCGGGCVYNGKYYKDTFCFDDQTVGICLDNGAYTTQLCSSGKCENNRCTKGGLCTDNFGAKITCPKVEETSHPNDPNQRIIKYVNCNGKSPDNPIANCDIFCVYKNEPTKRAECYPGQFGSDTDFLWWGPIESFKIGIINLLDKPIIIKRIILFTQLSIGNIDTGKKDIDTGNYKLNPNNNNIWDTEAPCGKLAPAGGRKVFVIYNVEGSNTDNMIGPIFSGCDYRLVISIK